MVPKIYRGLMGALRIVLLSFVSFGRRFMQFLIHNSSLRITLCALRIAPSPYRDLTELRIVHCHSCHLADDSCNS